MKKAFRYDFFVSLDDNLDDDCFALIKTKHDLQNLIRQ